jgi:hypothetical protein
MTTPPPRLDTDIRLSLEELALLTSLTGQSLLAKTMLTQDTADINPDELRGRMRAAGNTLLAKGVLDISGDELTLHPTYHDILQPMFNANYVLQAGGFGDAPPTHSLVFYVADDRIIAHQAHNRGLYHSLRLLSGPAEVSAACQAEFPVPDTPGDWAPPFSLTRPQLETARLLDESGVAATQSRLEDAGVPPAIAALFAEDLQQARRWSAMMRLWHDPDGDIIAETIYQTLLGESDRAWFMMVEGDADPRLHIQPASVALVDDQIQAVLEPAQP